MFHSHRGRGPQCPRGGIAVQQDDAGRQRDMGAARKPQRVRRRLQRAPLAR